MGEFVKGNRRYSTDKLVLDDDEIEDLAGALALDKGIVKSNVPNVEDDWVEHFTFIGWMLERMRGDDGYGIDVTLLGREQAKQCGAPYTAMGYSRDGIPCITPVMSNRGPAVTVALAIIQTSKEGPG